MRDKYSTIVTPMEIGPGVWKYLNVSVTKNGYVIGSYIRNYSTMYKTFYPFQRNGKWYALYSPKYTVTRVMELPKCQDIGGEKDTAHGFCPVEYYIPTINRKPANFGFVAGCIWGDDTSWKIQFLDLTRVEEGIIGRDDRFGYLELPPNMSLRQAITTYYDSDSHIILYISATTTFVVNSVGEVRQ